jgi:hypothetical protein
MQIKSFPVIGDKNKSSTADNLIFTDEFRETFFYAASNWSKNSEEKYTFPKVHFSSLFNTIFLLLLTDFLCKKVVSNKKMKHLSLT